jgi:hypothetical protein
MNVLVSVAVLFFILMQFFRFFKAAITIVSVKKVMGFLGLKDSAENQDVELENQLDSVAQSCKDLQRR